ncbi:acyl-CoA dehydrogenase family protein [Variovorax paradoxus]|uniref:acyl-CoA dehydrogenase family protein n=1 Tax=Variovorax paradoxus TaxID=34073 RepID=UPI003ED09645
MYRPSWMTAELETFRDTVRRFCEKELLPNEERWAAQRMVDREAWLKAGESGLLCPGISEEYGGGGGNFLHEAVAFSEQARMVASGLGNAVHSGMVAHYIDNWASEDQKRAWLPKMASGEMVGAIAMTEPGVGSDLQRIRTRAVRDGDHYVISGAKTYISNGQHANLVCVVVKTNPDPAAGAKGISIVVVETDKVEGFRRGRSLGKIGLHAQDTSELFFDEMRVPCANLLGSKEGEGFKQLMKELPRERLVTACAALGAMERAIEETLNYTSQRQVFGSTVLDMQNTRFTLAECETKTRLAAVFIDHCTVKLLNGELDLPTAAMAKYWVTEACGQVVDECLQLHGGAGYMMEYPIARLYQNVRVFRILAGTNEIMKELIARDLVKRVR